jgi:hypothetical protein
MKERMTSANRRGKVLQGSRSSLFGQEREKDQFGFFLNSKTQRTFKDFRRRR